LPPVAKMKDVRSQLFSAAIANLNRDHKNICVCSSFVMTAIEIARDESMVCAADCSVFTKSLYLLKEFLTRSVVH
jgi:hypothetical protein